MLEEITKKNSHEAVRRYSTEYLAYLMFAIVQELMERSKDPKREDDVAKLRRILNQ